MIKLDSKIICGLGPEQWKNRSLANCTILAFYVIKAIDCTNL